MTYAYPKNNDIGLRLKTILSTYREAGGQDACVVFHNMEAGRALVQGVGRHAVRGGKGLPARAIPFEVFHSASVGIDLLLAAICYGASQVVIVCDENNPEAYAAALREQMGLAEAILNGLGYSGSHFEVLAPENSRVLEKLLWNLKPASAVAKHALFNL